MAQFASHVSCIMGRKTSENVLRLTSGSAQWSGGTEEWSEIVTNDNGKWELGVLFSNIDEQRGSGEGTVSAC